jgi:hypothetical protein
MALQLSRTFKERENMSKIVYIPLKATKAKIGDQVFFIEGSPFFGKNGTIVNLGQKGLMTVNIDGSEEEVIDCQCLTAIEMK